MTTTAAPTTTRASAVARQWQASYVATLVVLDALAMAAASAGAFFADRGEARGYIAGLDVYWILPMAVVAWCSFIAIVGGYQPRYLGIGADEFKKVGDAAIRLTAFGALTMYVAHCQVSRGFVLVALPLAFALTTTGRWLARKELHRRRRLGRCLHRVLAIGPSDAIAHLVVSTQRALYFGYDVVGTLEWDSTDELRFQRVNVALESAGIDAVAVTGGLSPEELRTLAWQLEDVGAELIVAPGLTNVAGPRVHVRPVAGLPLLHLERPDFGGGWRLVKAALDRTSAAFLLLLLSPLLVAIGILIRRTSPGPALFTQQRLGRDGRPFTIYKFRTMVDGADNLFIDLVVNASGTAHGMFAKNPTDPRITRLGRWLRRYSIDELPQLINVLRGEMSLVGPRPLPIGAVQEARDARRRLLVRPGITGLWQVSGRSDLSWEEALRMDLYYVENWSIAFDLMIIWKTIFAVLRPDGAY